MSIIQQALKKAQNDAESRKPSDDIAVEDRTKEPAQPSAVPENAGQTGIKTAGHNVGARASAVAALVIVALAALAVFGYSRKDVRQAPLKTETASAAQEPKIAAVPIPSSVATSEEKTSAVFTDIIPNALKPKADASHLVLNGIMYLEGGSRAIINNSIVAEGEKVEGFSVVKINKKSVVLKSGDSETTLNLK